MTIEIINGDLLDAFDRGDINVIGHVVNCQHKMNSGIAKSIRERYPKVYTQYMSTRSVLGNCGIVALSDSLSSTVACNLYAQEYYGYDGKRYLNYAALSESLRLMSESLSTRRVIGFPYKMGSDRAKGDWDIVLEMVEFYFKDHNVKIYKLE